MKQLRWKPHQEARAKKKVTTMYKGVNGLLELSIDQFQLKSIAVRTRQLGEQVYIFQDQTLTVTCTHSFEVHSNCGTTYQLASNSVTMLSHSKMHYNISPSRKLPKFIKTKTKHAHRQ